MPVTYQRRGGGDAEGGDDDEVIVGEKGGGGLKSTMGTTKYELEDYVYEMECRAEEEQGEVDDVNTRLAQKERDLILAAELGKALLERNEVLVQQNERLAEEYSHKLEVCLMYKLLCTILYFALNLRKFSSTEVEKNKTPTRFSGGGVVPPSSAALL